MPALASADVARYQNETATFTMTQPDGMWNDWSSVRTHNFAVVVNPCDNTFSGTAHQSGPIDSSGLSQADWNVAGKFNANNTVSLKLTRPSDGIVLTLNNAPMDNNTVTTAGINANPGYPILEKFTAPEFTNTSTFKNHGDYVSFVGGGSDAAHSCIGMPITH